TAGNFVNETGWSGGGGGNSLYETKPAFQTGFGGSKRSTPDISSDADPNTGVCVYDSTSCKGASGWLVFGGTSVSSPTVAGMTNLAGVFRASSQTQLSHIYTSTTNFRDILSG